MTRALVVVGTRPEAIKMAPVLRALQADGRITPRLCVTGQHRDLLDLGGLGLRPDHDLDIGTDTLATVAAEVLAGVAGVIRRDDPDLVLVQGDTTSAFAGALAAFYAGVPVGHVEAGLRTGDLDAPWPEEGHRRAIDALATWHFAPTARARDTLLAEGARPGGVRLVGNTGIDALRLSPARPSARDGRTILVTVHRRENLGERLREVCSGVRRVARGWPDVRIVVPVHPNPSVQAPVWSALSGLSNVELVAPLNHGSMVRELANCTFVLTDSGGLQEEAPFFGKPVLVLRDSTERPEGVEAGTAWLVGTAAPRIVSACGVLLDDPSVLAAMSRVHHPYGDGYAAERIVAALVESLVSVREEAMS